MPSVQVLDRDAAPDQMVVHPVQLLDAVADFLFDRRRGFHVVKADFDGSVHLVLRFNSAG
jgi:hypothetical protein